MAWEFWIDRGGTFTDVIARTPDGRLVVEKLLSTSPHYEDAATEAISRVLAIHGGEVARIRIGTTIATNALLEREGEPTALITTQGLGDALQIGWQARPDIFARHIVLPAPLHAHVLEARERVTADGEVLQPLDEAQLARDLDALHAQGLDSVAIVFLHGWKHTAHEARAAELARAAGIRHVTTSHETAPVIKYIGRGDTTVVDAYLSPGLRRYVDGLSVRQPSTRLLFMQSNGGLVDAKRLRGKDAVLSGPAGGVVGMVAAGASAGADHLIGFDMGGTSTDVCHYAGQFERANETVVAGVRLRVPMLSVHTVAAGGGSICRFDGSRLRVGPHSAGADPGPACYRRGGPLTITDCNVALGRILPAHFPHVFGAQGNEALDADAAHARLAAIADDIAAATGERTDPLTLAEGFIAIAVETMAAAIKTISIERGHDLSDHALVVFGGAGGQHACRVAEVLGVTRIIAHPLAGVLSAWGIGQAPLRVTRQATLNLEIDEFVWPQILTRIDALGADAEAALRAQDLPTSAVSREARLLIKYRGSDTTLPIAFDPDIEVMRDAFQTAHRARFGFTSPETVLVVDALAVDAVGAPAEAPALKHETTAPIHSAPEKGETTVLHRAALDTTRVIDGPAIVLDQGATTVIDAGWRGRMDAAGNLILEHVAAPAAAPASTARDPVRLELFNNRFMAIAERMGATLQSTAASVNIKERLDFSCAVFDASGALIANAPHIPVHLGSMSDSVRAILATRAGAMRGGDAFMLNAPYNGGTHLPDITVIAPVFLDEAPAYFVAARGHHADIGGATPGSMPARSTRVEDEGVLIDDFQIVAAGRLLEAETRALFSSGAHPARNIDQNIADLKAQIAACASGAGELTRLVAQYGRDVVDAYMGHVQDNAAEAVRRVIATLNGGAFTNTLDDGSQIAVRIDVDQTARTAVIDFAGTSPQHALNFNAPRSVVRAAVLYVFRTLVTDAIPLNDGCMVPLTLRIPDNSMLDPHHPAAVVAGNVETSQAIVDTLYGALGLMAGSQGTMNNFSFGDATHQYYETICGGSGAGPDFDGASAVQVHMTNSRLTDPEILEARHPVLVEQFAIRRGSGGGGVHKGGDGVVRTIRFRAPMSVSLLTSRRVRAPFGLAGGENGACGVNRVLRANGDVETLAPTAETDIAAGDAISIETPGGGGFGA
ncbi:MAG: hydantoinase B/oxoprolinase family protein [Alphaproteobacteria bacterium]|nr:hydantoinase B/oxoprolinase family protein [Alphaproteobacteria bacterium]